MSRRETAHDYLHPSAFDEFGGPRYLRFDDLLIDLPAYRVSLAGRVIDLGPMEYKLLCFLLRHPSKAFTREQLIDNVWPVGTMIDERTVDVHIARIRRALTRHGHAAPIRTVRSVGYGLGRSRQ